MTTKCMKKTVLAVAMSAMLAGCAAVPPNAGENPNDPWEAFNRQTNEFNMTLDEYVLHPIAESYVEWVPEPVRDGVSNFFDNLTEPRNTLNNFLQGKLANGFVSLARFVINSTVGVVGLFDVADKMELKAAPEDFGQTLAVWGVPTGPYVVWPFFGPSTIRETIGTVSDVASQPMYWAFSDSEDLKYSVPLAALGAIDLRSRLLAADAMLQSAIDPYVAMREAYLNNRINLIYDGNPPLVLQADEFEDDWEEDEQQ